MRIGPYLLGILLALGLTQASQAAPQIGAGGLDLQMLDMNGAPFRSFHLGLYAKGLDNQHPAAATTLPSEELQHGGPSVAADSERYTGVSTTQAGMIPAQPDIFPLLQSYDQDLLQRTVAY